MWPEVELERHAEKRLKDIGVPEEKSLDEAVRSRAGCTWRVLCREGVNSWRDSQKAYALVPVYILASYSQRRSIHVRCVLDVSRESDKARLKCTVERKKRMHE